MVNTLSPFNSPAIPQFPTIISYGNKYHVDKDRGSNSNDGSSRNPWATLQYGVNQLTAGDTLIVHEASTGYDEWVYIANAGTNDNWITIKGADGEKVILQGRLTFNSTAEYILFKNIDIKGALWDLVDFSTDSHHLAIDEVEINCQSSTDNYTGIWVSDGVNNVWFRKMDIHHCGYNKTNPTDCSGICMKQDGISDITLIKVTAKDNKGDGFGTDSSLTGTDNHYKVQSVFFDRCTANNNTGDGFDIVAELAVINNSLSFDNGNDQGAGFKLWTQEAWMTNCLAYNNAYEAVLYRPLKNDSDLYILNCTFVGDNRGRGYSGELRNAIGDGTYGTNKVYLYNNIFYAIDTQEAIIFEDISKQTLAGEDNNYYFSATDVIAFRLKDNLVVDRSYTISEMGNGKWYASEGFGEHDMGKILDGDSCQLN